MKSDEKNDNNDVNDITNRNNKIQKKENNKSKQDIHIWYQQKNEKIKKRIDKNTDEKNIKEDNKARLSIKYNNKDNNKKVSDDNEKENNNNNSIAQIGWKIFQHIYGTIRSICGWIKKYWKEEIHFFNFNSSQWRTTSKNIIIKIFGLKTYIYSSRRRIGKCYSKTI